MSGLGHVVSLRPEAAGDENAIFALTERAFAGMAFSDGTELQIVTALRRDGDLTLSLVALDTKDIVGHIAFSPLSISNGSQGWYGLGPVSVAPDLQKMGIGSKLIRRGIADMRQMGARGIALLGSTEYYPRFGFKHEPQLGYPGAPAEYFQCLVLEGELPSGEIAYSPAFG